jgi:hypothetical protein
MKLNLKAFDLNSVWNPSQVWALPAVIVGVLSSKESTLIGRLFFCAIINPNGKGEKCTMVVIPVC